MTTTKHIEALTKEVFTFVSELYAYGVREVVISPGSRSTPLAIAIESHPAMKSWIHPDERSAAFFALGLIKGSGRPVAVLCTSGTAAANYTPAVAESHMSHLPLIVLTSDRPHELRGIAAPQAINQSQMFANYAAFQFDFPIADEDQPRYIVETVQFQLQKASQYFYGPHRGPIHFNIPFREPLTPDLTMTDWLTTERKTIPQYQKTASFDRLNALFRKERGLIIVGDMQHQEIDQIFTFATIHEMPILADPLSQLRQYDHPNVITTYDLLLRADLPLDDVQFVIRVGKPVISKALNQWLKRTDAYQILVQNHDEPGSFPVPPHVTYEMSANDFFRALADQPAKRRHHWLSQWQQLEKQSRTEVQRHMKQATDEAAYIDRLLKKLTKDDHLFVSNSMPIRDIDNLLIDCKANVYANRGANGIDGVVSTALGMAVHKKVTLLIGDLAFYHDMNGLLMSKLNDIPLNIILLNNDGGGIFSYLPQRTAAENYFERLFGTPTGLDFKHAALLYDFTFERIESLQTFEMTQLSSFGAHIYEIVTDRDDNHAQHQVLYQKLGDLIHALL